MAQILKLSEAGYDAISADSKNLILDSSKECFKIYQEGSGSITTAANIDMGASGWWGVEYDDIVHDLGFVPMFRIFFNYIEEDVDDVSEAPMFGFTGEGTETLTAYVDSTKLRIFFRYVNSTEATETRYYKYIIFANKLVD